MIETKTLNCLECTKGWENFRNLTKDQLSRINESRHEIEFSPGEIIFKQGSPCSNAIFLIHGMGKAYIQGFGGKKMIINLIKPGRFVAGPGTYVDERHHYTAQAITHVKVCFVDMKILKQLVHENSKFAEGWLKDISKKALHTFYKMISNGQKKMHGRLAEAILEFSDVVYCKDEFEIDLSRQELGELTNMAKESVVRILKEFSKDKIIEENCPYIKILDKEKLKLISANG